VARSGPIARRQILIQLDDARLRIALARLAEQDALIDVRQDDSRGELSVSLYGEVRAAIGAVLTALSRLGGAVGTPSLQGSRSSKPCCRPSGHTSSIGNCRAEQVARARSTPASPAIDPTAASSRPGGADGLRRRRRPRFSTGSYHPYDFVTDRPLFAAKPLVARKIHSSRGDVAGGSHRYETVT
jgi:hypothetical protein